MFATPAQKEKLIYNPIIIDGIPIEFIEEAEHVGIIRSINGNLPYLTNRISAHKKSLASVLFSGLARGHRANPAASLRVESIFATPVLMSGVASLVLSPTEISLLDQHYKETLQNIQKLHRKTPRCVVYFLSGCLPASAILHKKQLSLFGMITRLPGYPLNDHAKNILITGKPSSKSWFFQIRDLCAQYNLPHSLILLQNPPKKEILKSTIKSHVMNYWEKTLRLEASCLPSLSIFKPEFMSLSSPHPIWTTIGANPYEVSKAIQQARLLSGRYRTESLCSHWSKNKDGWCQGTMLHSAHSK